MINLKSPWVIGGGVLLGAVLLLRGSSNSAPRSDITSATLAAATSTDQTLGMASLDEQGKALSTGAQLASIAISARSDLASQQMANQYTLADTAIQASTAIKMKQMETTNNLAVIKASSDANLNNTFGHGITDMLVAGQMGQNDILGTIIRNDGQAKLMNIQVNGDLATTGMQTRLAKYQTKIGGDVAKKQIDASVNVAQIQADTAKSLSSDSMLGGILNNFIGANASVVNTATSTAGQVAVSGNQAGASIVNGASSSGGGGGQKGGSSSGLMSLFSGLAAMFV